MSEPAPKHAALLVVSLAYFMLPVMAMSINVALPSIARELMIDAVLLGWLPTSYFMASAVFVVPAGRIADIFGRKKVLLYGTIISAVTSICLALSNSAVSLIAFRSAQGFGAAMVITSCMAILSAAFPAHERGRAIGICIAAVYFGQSFAPFCGGFLTQHLGWRSIFLINVPLCLVVIFFIYWRLKGEWAEARGEQFDIIGSVIFALTIFSIIYGFTLLPGMEALWFILPGILGLWVFIKWEKTVKSPILDVDLFKQNRTLTCSVTTTFFSYTAVYAIAFLMSLYLQYIKGFSPQNAGIVLMSQPIIQAIFSPLAGRLGDQIQPRIVASAGMALTALGLIIFSFLGEDTTLPTILVSLMLVGFGLAFFSSPNTNAIMGSAGKRYYGIAAGTEASIRQVGMMFSMAIAMLVFALFIGRAEVTPENHALFLKSVNIQFIIFSALCSLGMVVSIARGKIDEVRT